MFDWSVFWFRPLNALCNGPLQLYDTKRKRTTFGNMSHEVQQLSMSVISQELNSTPDLLVQTTLESPNRQHLDAFREKGHKHHPVFLLH